MVTWTEEEIRILKTHYNNLSNHELAKLIPNKSPLAIYKKAYKMGYRKTKEMESINRSEARKGKPKRPFYLNQKGHKLIYMPTHKRADGYGYVFEHIVVWEMANKKEVPDGYVIHHINEIKSDNRIENLQLMTSGEHTAYHNSRRKHSAQTKKKMSQKAKERFATPENHPSYKNIDIERLQEEVRNGKSITSVCKDHNINRNTYYKKLKERAKRNA